jgi:hypothetical protein
MAIISSSVSLLENKFTENTITSSVNKVANTDIEIKNAQVRMWKALRSEPEITFSMEQTNEVLKPPVCKIKDYSCHTQY